MVIKITRLKCDHCGYEWIPRIEEVRKCAKCKTPYWNRGNYHREYIKARVLLKGMRTI